MNHPTLLGLIGLGAVALLAAGSLLLSPSRTDDVRQAVSTSTASVASASLTGTIVASTYALPEVTTSALVVVSSTTALVNGTLNPQGMPTTYWYEYGPTRALTQRTPAQTIGSGFMTIAAPAVLAPLRSDTTYYYRLSAKNELGTVQSRTYALTTNNNPPSTGNKPSIRVLEVANLRDTRASLRASITPHAAHTSYWFEYGTTTRTGLVTDVVSAGSGTSAEIVAYTLSNLAPNTTYHFRVNAQNQFGTTNSPIRSFTTGPRDTGQLNP